MFQFRRFPTYCYLIHSTLTEYGSAGFPHSEIRGSKLIYSSPRLIAVSHVLRRLLMPRHSPCALLSLTKLFWFSSFELCKLLQNQVYLLFPVVSPFWNCSVSTLIISYYRFTLSSVASLVFISIVQFSRCIFELQKLTASHRFLYVMQSTLDRSS